MIWAQNIPPAQPGVVPFPTNSDPLQPRELAKRVIAVVIVCAILAVGIGFLAAKYFRLSALDDYRTGYAFGTVLSEEGAGLERCSVAMERLYGEPTSWATRDTPGWGEFRLGCEDAVRGREPVAWYGLRGRLWGGGGGD